MNQSHSGLTAWGLEHVKVGENDTVLDIGCGGGRTIQRLAALASHGKVYGVDYAKASVAASRSFNQAAIEAGNVEVQEASVSKLPFGDRMFDLVTAVETHYYWPDMPGALREVLRVLKPGGRLLMIAEAYRGSRFDWPNRLAMKLVSGSMLTIEEHRERLVEAGYVGAEVFVQQGRGWICATGRKPGA